MMFPRSCQWSSRRIVAFGVGALSCLLIEPTSLVLAAKQKTPPKPVVTIQVAPFGFHPPGEIYLLSQLASTSLDFVDDTHLLFTFHESRLMNREPEPGHDDQYIRAVVIDTATGKADKTADWRMHDRMRYLLATGDGNFLVRQGNIVQQTDRSLELHPFLRFNERVFEMQLSPDRQMLVTELDLERHSPEAHRRLVNQALLSGGSMPDEDVQLQMIRLQDRSVIAAAKAENPVKLAVSSAGYVMHEQSKALELPIRAGDEWKITYVPFSGERRQIVAVHSDCTPTEEFLNEDTLLLTTCNGRTADRLGRAVSLSGKDLWSGVWDARLVWPNFYLSSAGKTFAIGWLRVSHPLDSFDAPNDSDVEGQVVQVLSTATGHLLLTSVASPVYSGGQNFALSADGTRFAVLNNGAIEVYEVPADAPQ
jgi:hypothetical protein